MIQHKQYFHCTWFDVVNSLWISYLCHGVLITNFFCHACMHIAFRCIVISGAFRVRLEKRSGFPPDWCEELYWWQCQQLLLGATTSGSNFHYHRFRRLDQGAYQRSGDSMRFTKLQWPNPRKKEGKLKLHEGFEQYSDMYIHRYNDNEW